MTTGGYSPPYEGPMSPVFPCREMPTRHCPAIYGAVCGDRPCARYESEDDAPWFPEVLKPALYGLALAVAWQHWRTHRGDS